MIDRCRTSNEVLCVARESDNLKVRHHVKTSVVRELATHPNFSLEFPLLIANMVVVKKTKQGIEFLSEWWRACQRTEWIDPFQYGALDSQFRWWTPEQGILSVLASNWVASCRVPRKYPMRQGRSHNRKPRNYHYLSGLPVNTCRNVSFEA